LRTISLDLEKTHTRISGYILAREDGGAVNLDNISKRVIISTLTHCSVCKEAKSAKHDGHAFELDTTLPT
jgi:hypothetical protein